MLSLVFSVVHKLINVCVEQIEITATLEKAAYFAYYHGAYK